MSHRNYTYLKVLIETFDNNREYIKFIITLYLCSYRYKRLCNINFIFNVVNNVLLPIRMLILCTNFYIHISGLRFIVFLEKPKVETTYKTYKSFYFFFFILVSHFDVQDTHWFAINKKSIYINDFYVPITRATKTKRRI